MFRSRVANGTDEDGKELYLANALPDKEAVDEVVGELENAKWSVRSVEKKERRNNPKAPLYDEQAAAGCFGTAGIQRAADDGRGAAVV